MSESTFKWVDNPLVETLVSFGGSFTGHGVNYILQERQHRVDRLLWTCAVVLGIALSAKWTSEVIII